jgi:hypothetical protein
MGEILLKSSGFPKERPLYFFKDVDDMVKQDNIRFFKLNIS